MTHIQNTHSHRLKTITTIYSFSFYSFLCLEIAGSIFSFITLLDICLQEYTEYNTRFHNGYTTDVLPIALTTVNDIFQIFVRFFFLLLPLTIITLQIISIKSKASWCTDKGIPLCNCHGGLFVLFTNTIFIETLHGLDMFLNTSFVPLL